MVEVPDEARPIAAPAASHGRLQDTRSLAFIDVARGIAILLVIVVHHGLSFSVPFTTYGRFGVQLFFVASAYTLCLSASARRREEHALRNFYIRRIFRIAPLYYIGIITYFAVWSLRHGVDGIHPRDFSYTPWGILLNVLFLHGFSPTFNNQVVPGGWSIATEMAFYAVFPLLLPILLRVQERYGRKALLLLVAGSVAANLILMPVLARALDLPLILGSFLFYSFLNQLPVFLIGMTIFLASVRLGERRKALLDGAAFVIGAIVTVALMNQPGEIAAVLIPPAVGVSFAGLLMLLQQLVRHEGVVGRVGQVSFSMYIFHFLFAFPLTKVIVAKLGAEAQTSIPVYLGTLLLTIALSFGVAALSKRFIEDRFINAGKRLIRRLEKPGQPSRSSVAG